MPFVAPSPLASSLALNLRRKFLTLAMLLAFAPAIASASPTSYPSVPAPAATTTTLTLTVGGASPSLVPPGTVVTLTATVKSGGSPVTVGQVLFCADMLANQCSTIHVAGITQLNSAGTATLRFTPSPESHSYQALFLGTNADATSTSAITAIGVSGITDSVALFPNFNPGGNNFVQATVTGSIASPPTGTVSYIDTTNANYLLGTATLGTGTKQYGILTNDRPIFGNGVASIVGDFNNDGFLDIAGLNNNLNLVTIYLGAGDGSFTTGSSIGVSATSLVIAVGDFNEDGNVDLAVGGSADVINILLGRGDGTFIAGANPAVGSGSFSMAVADFNGDGHADLAQANESSNDVTILLGHGDGTFTATSTSPTTSSFPRATAVGDFNGDGKQDLVISTGGSGGTLTVLLGNGDGTFTSTPAPSVTGVPIAVATGDFNGDGKLDLAVGDNASDSIKILKGNGDGTFTLSPNSYPTGSIPLTILVGDFDGDGKADLAVGNEIDRTITVLLGNGDGSFSTGITQAAYSGGGTILNVSAGDFNGDGKADLVAGSTGTAPLDVMLSLSSESTVASLPLVSPVGTGTHAIVGTYPGDGLYGPATSPILGLTASPVNTTLALGATPGSSSFGQQVALTATLAPYTAQNHSTDGESVTFKNGSSVLGAGVLHSGVATLNLTSLPNGVDQVTAAFAGETNFGPSSSSILPYAVLSATSLALTASPSTTTYGQAMTLTATLSPYTSSGHATNGELISFYSAGQPIGTALLSGGVATLNLSTIQAGSGSLTASFAADTYFGAATSAGVPFTINRATPTMTWTPPASAIYTGKAFSTLRTATSTTNGTIAYTITPVGGSASVLLATTILPAGSYTLTATLTPSDTTDYTTATTSASFTVSPATLTLVPGNPTRAYGAANPALSGSVTGMLNDDAFTVTGTTTATVTSPVGNYPITYTVSGTNLSNYTYTAQSGTLNISQAVLTIVPANASRTYGAANPTLSGSVTGALNGDTFSVTGATVATGSSPVGSYPIIYTVTGPNLADYSYTPVTASLSVTQASTSITWGAPASVSYGIALSALQLNASASVPGTFIYQQPAGTILVVGTSMLSVTFTPTDAADYKGATATVPMTVTPATLTILPTNATRLYGAANPALTGSVSGAVNGDTFTVTGTSEATPASPVGTYAITYTVTGSNLANYTYTPQTATLTITPGTPTLSWSTPAPIQYGTALSAAQLNATATLPGTITYSQASGTILPAGAITLSATFVPADGTNYKSTSANVSLTVTKAPLMLTVANLNRTFGSANPSFTGTVTGGVNGDTFAETFSTTATASSIVGSYPIAPSVSSASLANYTVTVNTGVLTVSQAGTATTFALSNSNLTLTATVASLTSGVPTGTVNFYVGQTLSGSGNLANGVATFTMASFPAGNVTLTAQYSGDANFTQSSSPSLFILAVTPNTSVLTVSPTGSVTDSFGLAVAPGYVGTVQFACSGLPKGATCNFSPASQVFTGTSSTANVTLTVQTGTTVAETLHRWSGVDLAGLFGMPGLLAAACFRRRRLGSSLRGSLLMLLLLGAIGWSVIGCAGGTSTASTSSGPTSTTPNGSSTIQILATGSGGLSQSTTVTLNVQ